MQKINLQLGKITYNEFHIDFDIPLTKQPDALLEDLVQIEYANGYLLDLGWYPEFDAKGSFIVQLIQDYNWENPVYMRQSKDGRQLKEIIMQAINMIKKLSPILDQD